MKSKREESMEKYNSRKDTLAHIERVRQLMEMMIGRLNYRADVHDVSKLREPEKAYFDEYTPKLKTMTYGSEEYKQCLQELRPALDHHYMVNQHHPEHLPGGVNDMGLIDLMEMICDWKAASERHDDGDIYKSIQHNIDRFNLSPQLVEILRNTVREM